MTSEGAVAQLSVEQVSRVFPAPRGRGQIEALKPEYRLALARDGYALVKCVLAVFKPEA